MMPGGASPSIALSENTRLLLGALLNLKLPALAIDPLVLGQLQGILPTIQHVKTTLGVNLLAPNPGLLLGPIMIQVNLGLPDLLPLADLDIGPIMKLASLLMLLESLKMSLGLNLMKPGIKAQLSAALNLQPLFPIGPLAAAAPYGVLATVLAGFGSSLTAPSALASLSLSLAALAAIPIPALSIEPVALSKISALLMATSTCKQLPGFNPIGNGPRLALTLAPLAAAIGRGRQSALDLRPDCNSYPLRSLMRPSLARRAEYDRRLHRVLAHIDTHLDEPINLARLARVANFSVFHLHRIFSAHVGETLGSYLTRRRVEQGAARLASQPLLRVLDVALAVGFGSGEAFTRAFKKHFGCAPSQWKTRPAARGHEKGKIGQVKSRLGQAKRPRTVYASVMAHTKSSPLQVTVTTRPVVRIAYLRYQGPFGEPLGRFWAEQVYPWLAASDLLGAPRYGVSRDDPQVTAANKCRYDAGAEIGEDFVPTQNSQIATVPGGLYACTKFKGLSAEIPHVWDRILREWLPASGYQLDARSCFEYYPTDGEYDEKTSTFTCELCMPIAKL